jgi:hypothetical protein
LQFSTGLGGIKLIEFGFGFTPLGLHLGFALLGLLLFS